MKVIDIISKNITRLRKEQSLTLEGLSNASGVSVQGIHNIVSGNRTPNADTLESIARGLKIETWKLLQPYPDQGEKFQSPTISLNEGIEILDKIQSVSLGRRAAILSILFDDLSIAKNAGLPQELTDQLQILSKAK